MALRWSDFILPSTLQLAPLLEVLIEPVCCRQLQGQVQLGLHEALVNAVRHGNGCDPAKYLRVRRIETPRWLVWQVQDQGPGWSRPRASPHCPCSPMRPAAGASI